MVKWTVRLSRWLGFALFGLVVATYVLAVAALVYFVWLLPDPSRLFGGIARSQRARLVLELIAALTVPTGCLAAIILRRLRRVRRVFVALTLLALVGLGVRLVVRQRLTANAPHVVLLTLDGFWAERMSIYGAPRAPTPFLDRLARRGLVGLNTYPQACCTTSGLLALLTGRVPIELKTLYPPHRLAPVDRPRGLPVLLGSVGFRTVSFTERHYSDARDLGLLGFDRSNGWSRPSTWGDALPPWLRSHSWAIDEVLGRLPISVAELEPPLRIGGPHAAVDKLNVLLGELDGARQPLFAHLHFLESHGPRFDIAQPLFSKDKTAVRDWDLDAYDDSLRELDENIADFFYQLGVRNLLDKTLVVVTSDHGKEWSIRERIPLLLVGPQIRPGWILENTQPIDVAPTILGVLGMTPPAWMSGRALTTSSNLDPRRIVLAAEVRGQQPNLVTKRWELDPLVPNHGLGLVSAIVCDRQYLFDTTTGALRKSVLPGKHAACPTTGVTDPGRLLSALLPYLAQFGYWPLAPPYVAPD